MRKAALFSLILSALPLTAAAKPPVVVELFTAQGCASCGEANAYLGKLAERQGVLALTFPVDYWDYLGWSDTFAKPEFTARQKAYVTRLDLREPYTPQMVVDGRAQAGGLQTEKVDRLVAQATKAPYAAPDMAFIGQRRVDVGSGPVPRGGAEVWLVRYDPREHDVVVKKGDNRGQTVAHHNVVREIARLGAWRGRPTAYRLPTAGEDGLVTAVLVQAVEGGRILSAAKKN
ncbi:MAG: DUF1223 domain-containing protein [Pseudomonadota bacterium]|uniref:DUF1223 domain-containing protein n=1 Tax=unclassified Phenylobacterium TaxID=2640670 RepID=UPI0006F5BC39|nr:MULTISPECIES: DUF1223 domain-containing protein [unclassified Phenylobacterium]KRB40705.1 hypothetical protein ASE02_08420 [Phenylobacterium sp. Root700]MBT9473866.1 DUF1223 domain-containing protein [Phenylobacterium sp.]